MTRDELAKTFDVSRQTLHAWQVDGCPVDGGVDAIREWLTINRPRRFPPARQDASPWRRIIGAESELLFAAESLRDAVPHEELRVHLAEVAWCVLTRACRNLDSFPAGFAAELLALLDTHDQPRTDA